MSKNYYDILGLSSNCNETDIIVAYRKLAIENHPRNSLSKDLHRFHEIAEAYEVLSDKKYRQSYDKFGEFGLKEGVPNGSGGFNGGYRYIGNSFEIFEKFFGSSNPFFSAFSESSSLRNFGIDNIVAKKSEEVPSDLIVEVFCTLEELYNGCKKVLSYSSLHLNADGKTSRAESHEKTIEIPKGSSQETIISFKGEGNEYKNHVTTNLVFKIIEIPHENFSRKGNDLIYYFKISLIDALAALPMRLTALDSRVLSISFDEIISPKTKKIMPNEGMPINGTDTKGRLIVRFHIMFPKYIPQEKKESLIGILS